MSGVDIGGRSIRKGAADAIAEVEERRPRRTGSDELVEGVARSGGTPLVVAENGARTRASCT